MRPSQLNLSQWFLNIFLEQRFFRADPKLSQPDTFFFAVRPLSYFDRKGKYPSMRRGDSTANLQLKKFTHLITNSLSLAKESNWLIHFLAEGGMSAMAGLASFEETFPGSFLDAIPINAKRKSIVSGGNGSLFNFSKSYKNKGIVTKVLQGLISRDSREVESEPFGSWTMYQFNSVFLPRFPGLE